MFPEGIEELGLWGDNLQGGDYYIALISRSTNGDTVSFTASINRAFENISVEECYRYTNYNKNL